MEKKYTTKQAQVLKEKLAQSKLQLTQSLESLESRIEELEKAEIIGDHEMEGKFFREVKPQPTICPESVTIHKVLKHENGKLTSFQFRADGESVDFYDLGFLEDSYFENRWREITMIEARLLVRDMFDKAREDSLLVIRGVSV